MSASELNWPELEPSEACPPDLRSLANTLLRSAAPVALFWGPQLLTYYSDAFRALLGIDHPSA